MRKNLFVVGGSRGIGASVARLGAENGYDVAVGYRREAARARELDRELRSLGARSAVIQVDIRDPEQVCGWFERAASELGSPDAVVVAAGITGPASSLAQAEIETLRTTIDVNVLGTLYCCREAARRMARSCGGAGGSVVLLSSGAATLGSAGEFVWYAASKGAVDSLTYGLAKELAKDGVRVNAVSPGLIETELHALSTGDPDRISRLLPIIPFGRPGTPEEIAEAILWLLSDKASYVSGAVLRVAGGR